MELRRKKERPIFLERGGVEIDARDDAAAAIGVDDAVALDITVHAKRVFLRVLRAGIIEEALLESAAGGPVRRVLVGVFLGEEEITADTGVRLESELGIADLLFALAAAKRPTPLEAPSEQITLEGVESLEALTLDALPVGVEHVGSVAPRLSVAACPDEDRVALVVVSDLVAFVAFGVGEVAEVHRAHDCFSAMSCWRRVRSFSTCACSCSMRRRRESSRARWQRSQKRRPGFVGAQHHSMSPPVNPS